MTNWVWADEQLEGGLQQYGEDHWEVDDNWMGVENRRHSSSVVPFKTTTQNPQNTIKKKNVGSIP